MDPSCRTCSDYPCTCGQAIGVPIDNGPGKPWTIRAGFGSDLSLMNYDDYRAQQKKEEEEMEKKRKERAKIAEENKKDTIKDWLKEEGNDQPEVATRYLGWSAITGDEELCKRALARGADYNSCFNTWGLFQHETNKITNEPMLKEPEFVEKITPSQSSATAPSYIHSVSQQADLGLRAVHIASAYGHANILKILLDCAKQKNDQKYIDSNSGRSYVQFTPLLYAVSNDQVACAKMLLNNGADRNKDDAWGKTPVFWAAKSENAEIKSLFKK